VGVVEAFDMPDGLSIVPSARFLSSGPVGGPFLPGCMTYLVTNRSSNVLSWSVASTQPWLNLSATHGQLAPHGGTNLVVCIATNATSLNPGVFRDTLVFSNATTGATQLRGVDLRIMQIAQMPFRDGFETGMLGGYWLSTGTGDFRTGVTATDQPHSGIFHVTLDSFGSGNYARNELTLGIDLAGYTNVTLRFWARNIGDEPDGPPPIPFRDGADFDGVDDDDEFPEAQEIRSLTIVTKDVDLDTTVLTGISNPEKSLEASEDGQTFRTVTKLPDGGAPQHTISFPPVKAKYFRVLFKRVPPPPLPGSFSKP